MNKIAVNKEFKLKCRIPIAVLAVISLICAAISCIRYFFYYEITKNGYMHSTYELTTKIPTVVDLIFIFSWIVPVVLFLLYVSKFYKKTTARIMSASFGIMAFAQIFTFIIEIVNYKNNALLDEKAVSNLLIMEGIEAGVFAAIFIMAAISAEKGFDRKIFVIVVAILEIVSNIIGLLSSIILYSNGKQLLYLLAFVAGNVSNIAFGLALLLFGVANRVIAIKSKKIEKQLANLQNEFAKGKITEDEYAAYRAEIIGRL